MLISMKTKVAYWLEKPGAMLLLAVLAPLLVSAMFAKLLTTHYYATFLYMILGLVFYVLVKIFGRETVFTFMIPLLAIALVLTGRFLLLDFYNYNDMNPFRLHPIILAWLVAFCLLFLEDLLKRQVRFDKVMTMALIVFAAFSGITFVNRGLSGISQEIHNFIGPITFFLYIYYSKMRVAKVDAIIRFVIAIAVVIGLIGLVEYVLQTNILQSTYNEETPTWLDSTFREGYRIKTTLGHPLDNALFFTFSMILVHMNIKNPVMKYVLLILFSMDILMTGSRSFFLVSFLMLVYTPNLFKKGSGSLKQQMIGILVALALVFVALKTPLGATFLNRFDSASDSTQARVILMDYFVKHLTSFHMMGLGGATENIVLLDQYHNPIYLENPWIILYFDLGYFVLLYLALLFLILRKVKYKYPIILFIIAVSGYNSFGVKSNANCLLFFLLAYGYLKTKAAAISEPDDTPKEGDSA